MEVLQQGFTGEGRYLNGLEGVNTQLWVISSGGLWSNIQLEWNV